MYIGNVNSGLFAGPRPFVTIGRPPMSPSSRRMRSTGRVGFNYGSSIDNPNAHGTEQYFFGDASTDAVNQTTDDSTGWFKTLLTDVSSLAKTVAPSVIAYQQAKAMQKLNIQRLKAGLPALSAEQAPSATVQVGVSPVVQKLALYGGGALLGVMLLNTMMKRR